MQSFGEVGKTPWLFEKDHPPKKNFRRQLKEKEKEWRRGKRKRVTGAYG